VKKICGRVKMSKKGKTRKVRKVKKTVKVKWGKIGAPKSAKRKAYMRMLRAKRCG